MLCLQAISATKQEFMKKQLISIPKLMMFSSPLTIQVFTGKQIHYALAGANALKAIAQARMGISIAANQAMNGDTLILTMTYAIMEG